MASSGSAVVLGGGGVVGTAWLVGLAAGLRRAGVDLDSADLIIGTSAGSIAGTIIRSGADLDAFATGPSGEHAAPDLAQRDLRAMAEMGRLRADPELDPLEARRRIGTLAAALADGGAEHLEQIRWYVRTSVWPQRLWITGLDIESGELVTWDDASDAPLLAAVAASCAVPTVFAPVVVNGRRYMDGGMSSPTNADLAVGFERLIVIEPLAHAVPREPLHREIAAVGAAQVVTIGPNGPARAAYGTDLLSRTAWEPTYRAGVDQASEVIDEIGKALG
ncbi:patatin-like phospholipase family protein [Nocardia callitridis]|uniref:Patatin-like phospholipase family protein n=1 Tax=Nocardia callitridis TaxID=648753 RepID=A0ABP9KNL5_9NOCA